MRPGFLLAVAAGGAVGALARWALGEAFPDHTGFPWTTFGINVAGSFLLALLPAFPFVRDHPVLPVLLGPGLLGGFTTLSAYAGHITGMLVFGQSVLMATYLLGTLAACLLAVVVAHSFSTPLEQQEFEDEEGNE